MANNILKWTERSRQENRKLFAYLLNEWGENIALKVRDQIIVSSDRIRDFPEQFPVFISKKELEDVLYHVKLPFSLRQNEA